MTAEHEHRWTLTAHADGCHWFSATYICPCGATAQGGGERDIEADSYAAIMMDPDGCERCRKLLDGAAPELARLRVVTA